MPPLLCCATQVHVGALHGYPGESASSLPAAPVAAAGTPLHACDPLRGLPRTASARPAEVLSISLAPLPALQDCMMVQNGV